MRFEELPSGGEISTDAIKKIAGLYLTLGKIRLHFIVLSPNFKTVDYMFSSGNEALEYFDKHPDQQYRASFQVNGTIFQYTGNPKQSYIHFDERGAADNVPI